MNHELNLAALPQTGKIVTVLLGQSIASRITQDKSFIAYHGVYQLPTRRGLAFLFNYAVIVFWGVPKQERIQLARKVLPYVIEPAPERSTDQYQYSLVGQSAFSIKNDHVYLPNHDPLVQLAISHAFAQSAKLIFFEDKAEQVIAGNLSIPKRLAKTGKISMSRKALARLRGILFDTSCDITLNFNLLDKPNFFWSYPELDDFYIASIKYLELNQRIELLNHKLSMIHELLDMLAEEQNHKHSSFLEWIIIVLIGIEIILFILSKH